MKRVWLGFLALVMIGLAAFFYLGRYMDSGFLDVFRSPADNAARTYENYKDSVLHAAETFNLPPEYLFALITLESSGKKMVPKRFEPHIYDRLKKVQSGQKERLENVKTRNLKGMPDGGLRNLSSSWGPFQIMGYKCFEMGIFVADIRGERSVYYGTRWIDENYGDELRKGNYKDAFHIHNTGRPYPASGSPATHNSQYVPNGLKLVRYFKQRLLEDRM